ncbi:MAG: sialate O-acetylesterase [Pirellulaceae bacterium]
MLIPRVFVLSLLCLMIGFASASAAEKKVRLFILSGQSNMAGLDPNVSFTPAVEKAFADDEVIVVKFAKSGQPIRRWYKKWQLPEGAKDATAGRGRGDLYDQLLVEVRQALGDKRPDSVAFVWMQGERDAKAGWQAAYYASLRGVVDQLREDLRHKQIAVVVGRLSDHLLGDAGWDAVRAAQEKVAADEPLGAWVDTDDLNGKEGLHYNKPGYAELGSRFAKRAIELIHKDESQ